MTYDHARRTAPRINVLRGWPGNETTSLTLIATPKLDEAILSGMVIVLDENGEWVKATASNSVSKVVYWATADQSDTDVISSGKLLGLSALGNYELQTAFFKADDTYADNDGLKVHSVAGYVAKGNVADNDVDNVAVASRGGVTDIHTTNSEATPVDGEVNVLTLVTRWFPARD